MAILSELDARTIDELKELAKLTGSEKTIVSNGTETRKVSIDTIVGFAASRLAGSSGSSSVNPGLAGGQSLVFVPEGETVPVNERVPGSFYLEESRQVSIRTKINVPTSVKVSASLGLRRV